MNPIKAFTRGMTQAFRLRGRMARGEYWSFVFVGVPLWLAGTTSMTAVPNADLAALVGPAIVGEAVALGATPAEAMVGAAASGGETWLLTLVAAMGLLMLWHGIAAISATVRRLHDVGQSGWWIGVPAAMAVSAGGFTILSPSLAPVMTVLVALAAGASALAVAFFILMPRRRRRSGYDGYCGVPGGTRVPALGGQAHRFDRTTSGCPNCGDSGLISCAVRHVGNGYSINGIENSPPSLMPDGQREVMVLVRV